MKLLLDTHILLWVLENNNGLTVQQKELIQNTENEKWVSRISFMELAIKISIGKLETKTSLQEIISHTTNDGFKILPIKDEHITNYLSLPLYENHRNPFDRFLISTAQFEEMGIISSDEKFQLYTSNLNVY
ncbi:MAG: type II toxin-antitoxin system VapC family toxin [Bacteroidota bacterium]